jgi:hypothetical protein
MSEAMTIEAAPAILRRRSRLSVITPAYNEERNLPVLYERLRAVLDKLDVDWEWIVTDDHSSDRTFEVLSEMGQADQRVRALRFSRNFGSHAGVSCGLRMPCTMDATMPSPISATAAPASSIPPAITPTVTSGGPDSALVAWSYNPTALFGFAGFRVYVETTSFASVAGLTPLATLSPSARHAQLDGLDRTKTYRIAVVGFNVRGLVNPAVTTVTWSPAGRYLLTFDGKDWSTISAPGGKTVNLKNIRIPAKTLALSAEADLRAAETLVRLCLTFGATALS